MQSLLIRNGQIVREQNLESADLLIEHGKITKLGSCLADEAEEIFDAKGLLIFPGLIDCHVHFREPGYEEAEDMMSGARSARSGGVTTVCDMPNTNPPVCTLAALADKLNRAKEVKDCDIRFFFNVSAEEHLQELEQVDPKDIVGVKLYFDHSTGNLGADKKAIEGAFALCAKKNIPVVCHCEDPGINEEAMKMVRQDVIEAHSLTRPVASEVKAIQDAILLSKKYGTALHIAHITTADGVELVRKAKQEKLDVTAEVTPHHLLLSVEEYEALGTLAKMNPPLRTKEHQAALWNGIADGTIDCIATDHAPHTLASKSKQNPLEAPSGVPGVETMLPLLLTPLAESHGFQLQPQDILRLCFTRPNQIFHLGKAGIEAGKPADLCLVNPKQSWVIHGKELHSKCGWTPFEGWKVTGKVVEVITP